MNQYTGFDWCITANATRASDEWTAFSELVTLYQNLQLPDDIREYSVVKGEFVTNYHLQAFIQFKFEMNKRDVIQYLKEISAGVNCYVAKRLGSPTQAAEYCSKAESSWEFFPLVSYGELIELDRHFVSSMRGLASKQAKPCAHAWKMFSFYHPPNMIGKEVLYDYKECQICNLTIPLSPAAEKASLSS